MGHTHPRRQYFTGLGHCSSSLFASSSQSSAQSSSIPRCRLRLGVDRARSHSHSRSKRATSTVYASSLRPHGCSLTLGSTPLSRCCVSNASGWLHSQHASALARACNSKCPQIVRPDSYHHVRSCTSQALWICKPALGAVAGMHYDLEIKGWVECHSRSTRFVLQSPSVASTADSGSFSGYCNETRIGIIPLPSLSGCRALPITAPKAAKGSSAFMAWPGVDDVVSRSPILIGAS